MNMKLELVPIPVTDVDRAKAFSTDQVGFNAGLDERFGDEFPVVRLTRPAPPAPSASASASSAHPPARCRASISRTRR